MRYSKVQFWACLSIVYKYQERSCQHSQGPQETAFATSQKIIMFSALINKSLHGLAPVYLKALTGCYQPEQAVRYAFRHQMVLPLSRTSTIGSKSLAGDAALWNFLWDSSFQWILGDPRKSVSSGQLLKRTVD